MYMPKGWDEAMQENQNFKRWQEMETLLKPFGFEHMGNGFFWHGLAGRMFDFSACSLDGVVVKIFMEGRDAGKRSLREEIKEFFAEITED